MDAVESAIARSGDVVVDLSYFTASDDAPAQICRERVAGSDIYLLIAGFRYGSPVRDMPEVSYPELEFATATELDIPRLIFMLGDETAGPRELFTDLNYGFRQEAFRMRLRESTVVQTVFSPAELETAVLLALTQLQSPRPRTGAATSRIWNIPARTAAFTGRDELLTSLEAPPSEARVLSGMSGVGKSATAIEFAHTHADSFDVAWWVNAEDAALIPDQLAALAVALDLTGPWATAESGVARLLGHLQREQDRWLLIFDHAEQPSELARFLPGGNGTVLITSRDPNWTGVPRVLDVDVFDRPESVRLLQRHEPRLSQFDAGRIAAELGDLPLAVDQAGFLLHETGMAAEDYLRLLQDRAHDLLAGHHGGTYPVSVAASWYVTFDRLADQHPVAMQLVNLLAWLAPEPVLRASLAAGATALPPPLDSAADALELAEQIGQLRRTGLLRSTSRDVLLHRIPAALLRARSMADAREEGGWSSIAVRFLHRAMPPDRTHPVWRDLLPHVEAACGADRDLTSVVPEAASLLLGAGGYLRLRGEPATALGFVQRAYAELSAHDGPDRPGTLAAAADLAAILRETDDLLQARRLNETTLALSRAALGADHPVTIRVAVNLARDLSLLGELSRARNLDERTLADSRRILGPDHPETLVVARNLADDYRRLGDHRQAHSLDEETLASARRVLGDDHPDSLLSANNLAIDLRALGLFEEARRLNEDVLLRRRRILGEDHPHSLQSAANLALDLHALGQHNIARRLDDYVREDHLTTEPEPAPDSIPDAHDLILRAFAMAGYQLQPAGRAGVLAAPEDSLLVTVEDSLDDATLKLPPRGVLYVVYSDRLRDGSRHLIDQLRVDGRLVIPLATRALAAAVNDESVSSLLADLRNFSARDNPFDTKNALVDEQQFFGRGGLLTRMGGLVARDEHILLTGMRKVGKTSLLNIFRQHLLDQPVCKIDLQAYGRGEDWHLSIFTELLGAMDKWARQRQQSWHFRRETPRDATAFRDAVDARLRQLGRDDGSFRIVLLLDEVERVFPIRGSAEEARQWVRATRSLRSIVQAGGCRLVIVAADLRPIANRVNQMENGETNPFYELFHEMVVPLFGPAASEEMIRVIAAGMDIQADRDFPLELHRLTGGHPSFIRAVAAEATRHRGGTHRLTMKDLDRAKRVMLEDGRLDVFLKSNVWDPLTTAEKHVITELVSGRASTVDAELTFELSQAHRSLRQQGLVVRDRVTVAALTDWIREREAWLQP